MTAGFVLIFLGLQLALVDSYLLTPRISNFLSQQVTVDTAYQPSNLPFNNQGPFRQVGYGGNQNTATWPQSFALGTQKRITPPNWLCWPVLFCGTVVLLHGASMRKN